MANKNEPSGWNQIDKRAKTKHIIKHVCALRICVHSCEISTHLIMEKERTKNERKIVKHKKNTKNHNHHTAILCWTYFRILFSISILIFSYFPFFLTEFSVVQMPSPYSNELCTELAMHNRLAKRMHKHTNTHTYKQRQTNIYTQGAQKTWGKPLMT